MTQASPAATAAATATARAAATPTAAATMTERLLDGLATSIAERGYRETTVADVVRHAKTSKRTFYEQFATKESCLIELLRRNNVELIARINATVDGEADWQSQIRAAVGAYVEHIDSRPAITLCWIREAPALGAVARPLHRQVMHDLTEMLVAMTSAPGFRRAGLTPIDPPIALILLGGLRELTGLFVEDGREVAGIADPAITAARTLLGPR